MIREPQTLAEVIADRNPRFAGLRDMSGSLEARVIKSEIEGVLIKSLADEVKRASRELKGWRVDMRGVGR